MSTAKLAAKYPATYMLLSPGLLVLQAEDGGKSLAGNLFYKYFKEFDTLEEYKKTKGCSTKGFGILYS